MSTVTPNLGLVQPAMADEIDNTIPALGTNFGTIDTTIGKPGNLTTTDKSSIVNAVNENVGKITALQADNAASKIRTDTINTQSDTLTALNVANLAGQGQPNAPIGMVFHHYTDAIEFQVDNVGENNTILKLKNANNPGRRPDKPADFIGSGKFIECMVDNLTGNEKRMFTIGSDGNLYWMDGQQTAVLGNNKTEDGNYAFSLDVYNKLAELFRITNNYKTEITIQHKLDNDYTEIVTGDSSKGLIIQTAVGDIILTPGTSNCYVNGTIFGLENGNYGRAMLASSGATASRPAPLYVGQPYFDTQIGKPIWCKTVSPAAWVDATGTVV